MENEDKIPDDEIDFQSIGKKVYKLLSCPFLLVVSNFKTFIAFILAAIILSISLKYTLPKTYKSSFIIKPSDIYDKLYLKVLGDIPVLLKQKDYVAISKILSLSPKVVNTLSGISLLNSAYKIGVDSTNSTEIVIETTDFNQFIPIQNAIIAYLENNSYYLKISTLQKKQINLEMALIDKEIEQIDSLKKLQLLHAGKMAFVNANATLLNEVVDPTILYKTSVTRYERKLQLIAKQAFNERFQLIKRCALTQQHSSPPRILAMCLYLVPAFMLLCIVFLLIKESIRLKAPKG
jgi:hypothetical protein